MKITVTPRSLRASTPKTVKTIVAHYKTKLNVDASKVVNAKNEDLNGLRHNASNYDEVYASAEIVAINAGLSISQANKVVSTLKNKVNNEIVAIKDSQIASLKAQLKKAQELLAVRNAELVVCEATTVINEVKTFVDTREDPFILANGSFKW